MNIIFSLHIVLLLSLSSFNAHSMETTVVKHATIDLKELILDMLKDNKNKKIIAWLIKGKVFCINPEEFTTYYQKRTGSTTNEASLVNRLTKSKNNIIRLPEDLGNYNGNLAPLGYKRSYKIDCDEVITTEMLRQAIANFIPPPGLGYGVSPSQPSPSLLVEKGVNSCLPSDNHKINHQIINTSSNNNIFYDQSCIKYTVDNELMKLFGAYMEYKIDFIINQIMLYNSNINENNLRYVLKLATNNSNVIEHNILKDVINFLGPLNLLSANMQCLADYLRFMFHGFIADSDIKNIKTTSNNKCRLFYILNKPNNNNEELPCACLLLYKSNNDNVIKIYIFKDYWCNGYFIYGEKNNIVTKKNYNNMKELVNDLARDYEDYTCEDICYNIIPHNNEYVALNKIRSELIVDDI